jgi:predicted RNA-binding Zn ribbon-like protein
LVSLSWSVPEETKPAPRPLLLVQAFINTWDAERGTDVFLDPTSGRDWLTRAGMWRERNSPEPAELFLARNVREDLRAVLAMNNGGPPPASDDLRTLQALIQASSLRMEIEPDGQITLGPESDSRLETQLARLLVVIRDAQREGTWMRLKACHNPECRWAFYDRSHSQRGTWCDMAVCGNRIKNRRLRERRT